MRILPHVFVLILLLAGCRESTVVTDQSAIQDSQSSRNLFSPPLVEDEAAAEREINRAWSRYLKSTGQGEFKLDESELDNRPGLTDSEIADLESRLCQRLPAQLKAFLKVCHSRGKRFEENFEIYTSDQIVSEWTWLCELNYLTLQEPGLHDVDPLDQPAWFESYLIPIMAEHTELILIDIRNGKVLESMDSDVGSMAGSLVELLDGLAEAHENGKHVGSLGEGDPKKFLDSVLWEVWDREYR